MGFFNRKKQSVQIENVDMTKPGAKINIADQQSTTSYVEIYTNKGNYHIRIRGGDNKIRFHGENMYSYSNAVRAAKLFSKETGLRVVNRSAK